MCLIGIQKLPLYHRAAGHCSAPTVVAGPQDSHLARSTDFFCTVMVEQMPPWNMAGLKSIRRALSWNSKIVELNFALRSASFEQMNGKNDG